MRPRTARTLIFLLTAMGTFQSSWGRDDSPRIWIIPFQQLQVDTSLEHLKEAIPALLTVASSSSGENYSVVERQVLNKVLAEQSLTLEALTSTETRHRIGKLLGATVIVTGSFARQGDRLLVTMRALDVETGIITASAEGHTSVGELGQLVASLYGRLAASLGRQLPSPASAPIDEAPASNLHFMKGLAHYYGGRYSHAVAEFVAAGDDQRLTDVSRFWLANTYIAQQQYAHAYLELSRLASRRSGDVRESDVQARLRACEQHLDPEDVRLIRNLAGRPAPVRK